MPPKIQKTCAIILCLLLIFEQSGLAQAAGPGKLDVALHLSSLRQSLTPDKFRPLHLRYLSYNASANNFQLLLDKGDFLQPKGQSPAGTVPEAIGIEATTKQLLNHFFVGVSLPNDSFWVNLRPDSPDNIIDDYLAETEVGKILLEADLQLKKDTANYTNPQTLEGKTYWTKLYKKAEELFGYENITIPTLTRPWIVPGEIIVREAGTSAYIYKAAVKVMLEEDYLKEVKGLLDMGVKPVYKLTTASGRSIKTTANHPYLVNLRQTQEDTAGTGPGGLGWDGARGTQLGQSQEDITGKRRTAPANRLSRTRPSRLAIQQPFQPSSNELSGDYTR